MKRSSKLLPFMLFLACAFSLPILAQDSSGVNEEATQETTTPAVEMDERGWSCLAGNQGCRDECKEIGEDLGYAKTYWTQAYCDWDNDDGPFGAPIPICVCGKS